MSPPLSHIPEPLRAAVTAAWDRLLDSAGESRAWYQACAADAVTGPQLARVFACSTAAAEICQRDPAALPELARAYPLADALPPRIWRDAVAKLQIDDEAALNRELRKLRNRAWLRIVWRDLNRLADTAETVSALSALADACLQRAIDFHHAALVHRHGEPCDAAGNPQQLVVLAMGKLGGEELNLSSDIDLIFAFPESGETNGRRSIENSQFFIKLGQKVIGALDNWDSDGFVFRVDMRLRPWGESGPLAVSFDAIEVYYEQHGRDWERYALIKARACAGDIAAGEALLAELRPFVYRRYLDFAVLESLREMKAMIRAEVRRRQLDNNVKLGAGGIREVEFIAQCLQLIRGGQMPLLQCRSLLDTLTHLVELELLSEQTATEMRAAYLFLRDLEHAIQALDDAQTQELPEDATALAAVAFSMGAASTDALLVELQQHRDRVAAHFNELIDVPKESVDDADTQREWRSQIENFDQTEFEHSLQAAGFAEVAALSDTFAELLQSRSVQRLPTTSRDRLFNFLPLLLMNLQTLDNPVQTLQRLQPMIEAVLRRSTYLVLLTENDSALDNLISLVAESPWIARNLGEHPLLLDEMLDARRLYSAPDKAEFRHELAQRLLRIAPDDDESFMDALRYFKLTHTLRVAAAELSGRSPLMVASDHLTWLAEVILEATFERCWAQMVDRYGVPGGVDPTDTPPFLMIGYGKLGGIELSYGSDLDLVFVHGVNASLSTEPVTSSARSVDNGTFMARLGQRMIHILSTRTRHGDLYEVDMRLRPAGNSGLLVSSVKALREYQERDAWTWEHQALVRARALYGSEELAAEFGRIREAVLCRQRDVVQLREEVVAMREKMRAQLVPARPADDGAEMFDLKHSEGAIVDIEFMVQYAVLADSHRYPSLARYTDNIRILESLGAAGLWQQDDVDGLSDAYRHFRSESHRLSLRELPAVAMAGDHARFRDIVRKRWQELMQVGDS